MFSHVPATARKIVLTAARDARDGAKTRAAMGMSTGDNAFSDCLWSQAQDLSDALRSQTRMHIPVRYCRRVLNAAVRAAQ